MYKNQEQIEEKLDFIFYAENDKIELLRYNPITKTRPWITTTVNREEKNYLDNLIKNFFEQIDLFAHQASVRIFQYGLREEEEEYIRRNIKKKSRIEKINVVK